MSYASDRNDESVPLIRMRAITKVFYTDEIETHALSGVHCDIQRGEFVSISGPSGCGKSTLLAILGLLDTPSSGEYLLNGRPVGDISVDERATIRNREIGFIFQSFNLIPRTSAVENVELPLIYAGVSRRRRRERALAALALVGLSERTRNRPNELSGGQQQRVAVARALVTAPALLLADEPTGNLDSRSTADILDLFDELHAEGRTIVLVTHEDEVGKRAGRVVWMRDGQIAAGHVPHGQESIDQ